MANEYEIFKGKSLSDLFKDIYDNTTKNKEQLEVLMKEVVGFIKDGDTAVQIIPMLKEYLEINVKNDEHIVRIAQIAQRAIAIGTKAASSTDLLTEEEKQQLLSNITLEIEDLQQETTEVEDELERLKVV